MVSGMTTGFTSDAWISSSTTAATLDDGLDHNIRTTDDTSKALYLTFGCLGIVGNIAVIVTISRMKKLSKLHTYRLIMNQSIVDTLSAVFIVLTTVTSDTGTKRYLDGAWDELVCRFWTTGYPLWSMFMSSTYALLLITGERYLAIVHPLDHRVWLTSRRLTIATMLAWSVGPVYNLLTRIPTSGLIDGKCGRYIFWPSKSMEKAFGIIALNIQFFIPIIIHILAYGKMIKVMRSKIQPADSENKKSSLRIEKSTRALFRTMITVTICFFLCWVMNQVNFLLFNFGRGLSFSSDLYHVTVYAAFSNCFVNPVVYAWRALQERWNGRKLADIVTESSATNLVNQHKSTVNTTPETTQLHF